MLCKQRISLVLGTIIAAITMSLANPATAAVTVVENIGGAKENNFASGRIEVEGVKLANWSVVSSVSGTDFANDAISGGNYGAQYVMFNGVLGSTDVNTVYYSVLPIAIAESAGITISQSPYFDAANTWNGGNVEASQFRLTWAGGELAGIVDPDDQIAGLDNGALFASGTILQFSSFQILNSSDTWQVQLPAGVESVQVDWSSTRPAADSDLTREWITFNPVLTIVPEPVCAGLFGLATLLVFGCMRYNREIVTL